MKHGEGSSPQGGWAGGSPRSIGTETGQGMCEPLVPACPKSYVSNCGCTELISVLLHLNEMVAFTRT